MQQNEKRECFALATIFYTLVYLALKFFESKLAVSKKKKKKKKQPLQSNLFPFCDFLSTKTVPI